MHWKRPEIRPFTQVSFAFETGNRYNFHGRVVEPLGFRRENRPKNCGFFLEPAARAVV
jgi:hypothetical protein